MNFRNSLLITLIGLGAISSFSCKKNSSDPDGSSSSTTKKTVSYTVTGTKYTVSFIDSTNSYEQGVTESGTWTYTFKQGSGANIGMTIALATSSDTIDSWEITVDGKLYANAYSAGGAFFTVPY